MSTKKPFRLVPGTKVGPYEIIEPLGQGGMGEVYKAFEPSLHRMVALKTITPSIAEKEDIIKRFHSEARVLAKINHPNVVTVHSLGSSDGIEYMVMEFVDGKSLLEVIKDKPLSIKQAIPVFQQILAGTAILHKNGIIHRDLKPGNVIQCQDGTVKIVDLGIAKLMESGSPDLTAVGEFIGSPRYMAPEITVGDPPSVQSDIWALGLIFYEMLTGQSAYYGKSKSDVLKMVRTKELSFSSADKARLPIGLMEIIHRMATSSLDRRYQRVNDIIEDINVFMSVEGVSITSNHKIKPNNSLLIQDATTPISIVSIKKESSNQIASNTHSTKSAKQNLVKSKFSFNKLFFSLTALAIISWITYFGVDKNLLLKNSNKQIVNLQTPQHQTVLFIPPLQKIKFEWNKIVLNDLIKLQISSDPQFNLLVLEEINPKNPFEAQLNEGVYYWRVVSQKNKITSNISPEFNFKLVYSNAPTIIYPQNDTKLRSEYEMSPEQTTGLIFRWEAKLEALKYQVQISSHSNFEVPLLSEETSTNSYSARQLHQGTYYWRVRVINPDILSSYWSVISQFSIGKIKSLPGPLVEQLDNKQKIDLTTKKTEEINLPKKELQNLDAPTLVQPQQEIIVHLKAETPQRQVASELAKTQQTPQFNWNHVQGAQKYQIKISKDKNFKNITETQTIKNNNWEWQNAKLGEYYWNVTPLTERGQKGPSSIAGRISLLHSPPKIEVSDSKNGAFTIKWSTLPVTAKYLLQVSEDKQFDNITATQKLSHPTASLTFKNQGTYYIRVAGLDSLGNKMSQFSLPQTLLYKIGIVLNIPRVISPMNETVIVTTHDRMAPIMFEWQEIPEAKNYQLQFSLTKDFTNVFHLERVRGTRFILQKQFPMGLMYWRLRAENGSEFSKWTKVYSFEIPSF